MVNERLPGESAGSRVAFSFRDDGGTAVLRPRRGHHTGLILTVLLICSAIPAHADLPVAREITDPSDLLDGPSADGQVGDLLLSNGDITAIIESVDHANGDATTGGHVIDAASAPLWFDELDHCYVLLVGYPRQAVYDTVRVENDGAGGEAVVLARGQDSGDPAIEVTTRYFLAEGDNHIRIETSLTNSGSPVEGYKAGDVVDWGETDHFSPGIGFDLSGTATNAEWLASAGEASSYGYTKSSGNVRAEHGESWSNTTVRTIDIDTDETVSYTRYLAVGGFGLSSASDILHEIRGMATGTLEGTVAEGGTSAPIFGATLDCLINGIAPYTQIRSGEEGGYSATLPPVGYELEVTAPGYFPGSSDADITASQTTELDIELWSEIQTAHQGDTLTVVMRPILSVPAIVTPGSGFEMEAMAPSTTTNWSAELRRGSDVHELAIANETYRPEYGRWFMNATVPDELPAEMYDLYVEASGGVADTVAHSVMVRQSIEDDFYFIQITDTHLPTRLYWDDQGSETDSTSMVDLRAVIDDVNIINPAFVVVTGDVVNEGELEDFLGRRVFTKAQRIMKEFDVPVFLSTGNHDVGGWWSTPPPPGTSRRTWWRFFGWRYLDSPPPAEDLYTQNYSFDYAGAHIIGMESYINYEDWRMPIYGDVSFTSRQMNWLAEDLALADPDAANILFHHYDFDEELNPAVLGVDCILFGHTHSTFGQIVNPPFNLSTDSVTSGERTMRLVRVSGNSVMPTAPIRAGGGAGHKLTVSYDVPNDGTSASVAATVTNFHTESFEHGMLRFYVTADSIPYGVDNGELVQTIVDGDVATCYVEVPIAAANYTYVTIRPTTGVPELPNGQLALLRQSSPNPARAGTTIEFVLAFPAEVTLEVYDLAGRSVTTLVDGPTDAGEHAVPWDLTDAAGGTVASGVYFYRLDAGEESITKKMVVTK
jgi:predicted MPP superfamily phosphohydrolase